MSKRAYDRGSAAISRQLDEDYKNNPHAQANRVISGLENRIDTLESRLAYTKTDLALAQSTIEEKDRHIADLESALALAERRAALEHEQFMRWFRHAENLREKWVIQSKVIRTALSPEEYRLARDIVAEYDGV